MNKSLAEPGRQLQPTTAAKPPVLIVDDELEVRHIVAHVLRRHNYEVVEASNGEECIDLLRRGFEGVILMDVQMPGITGWKTIEILAKENLLGRNLICMETGVCSPGAESVGLEEHVFDYLSKPYGMAALRKMVENAAIHLCPENNSDRQA